MRLETGHETGPLNYFRRSFAKCSIEILTANGHQSKPIEALWRYSAPFGDPGRNYRHLSTRTTSPQDLKDSAVHIKTAATRARFRYNRATFGQAEQIRADKGNIRSGTFRAVRGHAGSGRNKRVSASVRLREIRAGFEPAFWIANFTELFERLAYYAQSAVLAIFLHEELHLSTQQTGTLMGIRSVRVSQIAGLRVPDSHGRIFPDGLADIGVDCPGSRAAAAVLAGIRGADGAGTGPIDRKAMRRGDHCASLE
jgi:hypothetical protein